MQRSVYINATGTFLPNEAVSNERIEEVLGLFKGRSSKGKSLVLASNQIKSRHYAIDPVSRKTTHTNAQLCAEAARELFAAHKDLNIGDVRLLCTGTSTPDLLIPGHGSMVHGLMPTLEGEVMTFAGVCCSSAAALKTAFLNVQAGESRAALVTGSEIASKFLRAEFFESESEAKVEELKKNPMVAFEHDFLRWMLSDGAGAAYLSDEAVPGKTNLRINWIEGRSYANEQPVCMMAGGHREKDDSVTDWKELRLGGDPNKIRFAMNCRQDIRLLREQVPIYTVERPMAEIKKKRGLRPGDYTWFLPHYSSHFFREVLFNSLAKVDFEIPYDRWFTTLYEKGNVGSASIFIFLHELLRTQKLTKGEKILCYVPESARFSVYYAELEVV